ncbi:beta-aspartyl-peptidase [Exilibacterium tricleocarpae]|uniref:Isoaspartyl dipeptidase n=1 Tax=Exilibacterium tricleocarpae TaxID=2591008 RepID=A0A545TVD4_9GAMM|nr:beta-aspartyl-peptidase [Exilibacterium tricleocarpae]TQV81177.1 beta-aspartyl-peptidase [Exilibacterium tricleocarpae]
MLTLIRNAEVFSPAPLGCQDVLIAGKSIAAVGGNLSQNLHGELVTTVDAKGRLLVPGFVDSLVHIAGGGGEGGFGTRTEGLRFEDAVRAGVTTVVGALGTDACTRSLRDLYGKSRQLSDNGLTCYIHTGSYEIPPRTLTGSARDDIVLIDSVIGVGEVAIADHRSSQPTVAELAKLAADVHVAGLLSGKPAVVSVHVGDGRQHLLLLNQVLDDTELPIRLFYPTHINRSKELLAAGWAFAKRGGAIDFTTSTTEVILEMGEIKACTALRRSLEQGVALEQITLSSDAQGSLPHFNAQGNLDGLEVGAIGSLHRAVTEAVTLEGVPFASALATVTANPARILGLGEKGCIAVGRDADLQLLDPATLVVDSVMARGNWLLKEGELTVRTPFERGGDTSL